MPERICLSGYSGQTVAELLALEPTHRIDLLIRALGTALDQKIVRDGIASLTTEELTILSVVWLECEVNNGGYHQFFVNTMVFAPQIVPALRRIGCPKFAEITEKAVAALRLPVLSVAEIERVIYDDDDERDEALHACDDQFFEYPEPIHERLFAFIKANARKFRL